MAEELYWADAYVAKKRDAESAIRLIRSGQRVFIGSACGEPQELVRSLAEYANLFTGLEIVRMMSQESSSCISSPLLPASMASQAWWPIARPRTRP